MEYIELTKEEKDYIQQLYHAFATGRDFELFLNYFLKRIGFQEVVTTKYVKDNGIDLTCTKPGIDPQGLDTMNYYVQAKRYQSKHNVQANEIRDFKGATKRDKQGNVLNNNYINLFITTSSFTKGAIDEAESNPHMPTILIDGKMLLNMCIDNGIGFSYKPVFKQETIKNILSLSSPQNANIVDSNENNEYIVEREITANDIRARILIVPQIIKNTIDSSAVSMVLEINGQNKELNLDKSHRYFGGITQVYKECGLINKDKTYIKKRSKWKIDNGKIIVVIE